MIQIGPATGVVSQIDVLLRSAADARSEIRRPLRVRRGRQPRGVVPQPGSGWRTGQLLHIFDPDTGEARELATLDEGTPVAMAVASDALWILNDEGTLTHVRLG